MKKYISIFLCLIIVAISFVGCSTETEKEPKTEDSFVIKNTYDSVYANEDQSVLKAYDDVCNAIINFESSVRLNTAMIDNINQLLYTSFPLVYLTNGIEINEDKSGVTINFLYNEAEHKQKVKAFNDKIKSIEDECDYDSANEGVYILNAYAYVSKNIKFSVDSTINVYDTIMKDEGSVFSYSNMFEYLLRQKGIEAYHILANDFSGKGWSVSMARLNGELYYFDVSAENYDSLGAGLSCFAMNSNDLKKSGLKNPKYSTNTDSHKCKANEFKACRSCKSYTLNQNTIKMELYNDETVEIELK